MLCTAIDRVEYTKRYIKRCTGTRAATGQRQKLLASAATAGEEEKASVFGHFNAQYRNNAVYNEDDILRSLPPSIASDLCFKLYGEYITRIPLFRERLQPFSRISVLSPVHRVARHCTLGIRAPLCTELHDTAH
eukprot:SAG11_NODE_1851_length_4167_cov_1.585054_4_plen_134_part_00